MHDLGSEGFSSLHVLSERKVGTFTDMLNIINLGGSGPLLLCLHCNGFPAAMFEPMAIVLVQTFHVLLLHMPGHGESERMEDGWQPLDMAQRIFSTIR